MFYCSRFFLFSWCVLVLAGAVNAQDSESGTKKDFLNDWLVTPQEALAYQGEDAFNAPTPLRTRSVAPLIQIVQPVPVSDLKVKSPFPISVQFKGLSDALIDPKTFKVLYGTFKLDITDRITKYVKVDKEGFSFDQAKIPSGKHRLILQVQDEKKRMAERELKVEVE